MPLSLAAALGLRRGEILGLRWADVHLDGRTLAIANNLVHTSDGAVSKLPKSESSRRTLQMPEGLALLLRKEKRAQAERRLAFGPGHSDEGFV